MITIPNDLQSFALELAALAKKYGINRISGEFWPGYEHEWRPAVRFSWLQGRHGAAADQITLTSEHTVVAKPTPETVPAPEASIVKAFERSPRRVQETSPVQAVCDRAVHLADVPTPLKQETPAEPPRPGCEEWWHLKQYGYAPGGYIITCFDCKQKVWDCDKRASICRPCAEKRHAAKTSPAPAEHTVWTKTSDSDPYCIHCGKTWDMHICDGRSSCPTSNRRV
jgi:hypothetical protein